ncbi:MAG: hypothetical protein IJA10_11530 [Lachnospiraceae bacterium]|nr:hypothetical protein [Lachnospiraceae bacterium]
MLKDEIGNKYGKLTVIRRCKEKENGNGAKWLCNCDCGNSNVVVNGGNLRGGTVTSCGCSKKEYTEKYLKEIKEYYKVSYEKKDNYILCTTSKGDNFLIDTDDYEKVKDYTWRTSSNGYIVTTKNRKVILLHRLIMNPSKDLVVDHINHNKKDNRKNNPRICTMSNNNMNKSKLSTNTSGVTGVTWNEKGGYWVSQIGLNNNTIILGYNTVFDKAVKLRKDAEEKYFKEYSYSNSIKKVEAMNE